MRILLLSILLVSFVVLPTMAQEKKHYEGGPLSHINVALRASTMGVGIEAATPINSYFKLRAGINYMGFKTSSTDISLDDDNNHLLNAIGFVPEYRMKGDLGFTNGHMMVDFHPMKNGIFHITVGAFVGQNKLKAKGQLVDPTTGNAAVLLPGETWPELEFDGNILDINGGRLDAALHLGNVIKPYAGIGIGRSISKSRFGFKFEVGAIYQGDYTLKQNGKEVNTTALKTENFADADKYTKWLKWWPMVNFQLTYRIY